MATLTDYRTRLDTEPLTGNQLGRIMAEFDRLGLYSRKYHRAERLRLTAILADYPGELETTKDLTQGEAGRVVRSLIGCRTRADLMALAEPPIFRGATPWREAVATLAVALYGISSNRPGIPAGTAQ
jgi:hypothetical protein